MSVPERHGNNMDSMDEMEKHGKVRIKLTKNKVLFSILSNKEYKFITPKLAARLYMIKKTTKTNKK